MKVCIKETLTALAVMFLSSNFASGGGRVGMGGLGDSPQPLDPNAPPISKIDPFTKPTQASNGCKIPTGEVDIVKSRRPGGVPQYLGEKTIERRIAPSDDCHSIEMWSFYRSRENQEKLHDAPTDCKLFNHSGNNRYELYTCQKIPYYSSLDAATAAGAKAPFAYAHHDKVEIDYGELMLSRFREIFDQNTPNGKAIGTDVMTVVQLPHVGEFLTTPSCAISDSPANKSNVACQGLGGNVGFPPATFDPAK